MVRIRLIHWNETEAADKAKKLEKAGYQVDYAIPQPAESFRELREDPPAAVVIDLTRLPSHGRDFALGLRTVKATRNIPLVFLEGPPEKVERIKELLPDAEYATWSQVRSTLKRAIANPPEKPVVPSSNLAGYSKTPLTRKLGIQADSIVGLVNAPDDFEELLEGMPDNVRLRRQPRTESDLVIWFPKSCSDLKKRVTRMGELAGKGGLWIAWPKTASGVKTDMTQAIVRKVGLDAGLVDYKICAIDATWSALRFTQRR